jgi:hypothetical protein
MVINGLRLGDDVYNLLEDLAIKRNIYDNLLFTLCDIFLGFVLYGIYQKRWN